MILLEVEKHIFEKKCLDRGNRDNRMEYLCDFNTENNFFLISCEIHFHYNCLRTSGRKFNFIQWLT